MYTRNETYKELLKDNVTKLVGYLTETAGKYIHIGEFFEDNDAGRLFFLNGIGAITVYHLDGIFHNAIIIGTFHEFINTFKPSLSTSYINYFNDIVANFIDPIIQQEAWKQFESQQINAILKSNTTYNNEQAYMIIKRIIGSFIYALVVSWAKISPNKSIFEKEKLYIISKLATHYHLKPSEIIENHEIAQRLQLLNELEEIANSALKFNKKSQIQDIMETMIRTINAHKENINTVCLENCDTIIISALITCFSSIPDRRKRHKIIAAKVIHHIIKIHYDNDCNCTKLLTIIKKYCNKAIRHDIDGRLEQIFKGGAQSVFTPTPNELQLEEYTESHHSSYPEAYDADTVYDSNIEYSTTQVAPNRVLAEQQTRITSKHLPLDLDKTQIDPPISNAHHQHRNGTATITVDSSQIIYSDAKMDVSNSSAQHLYTPALNYQRYDFPQTYGCFKSPSISPSYSDNYSSDDSPRYLSKDSSVRANSPLHDHRPNYYTEDYNTSGSPRLFTSSCQQSGSRTFSPREIGSSSSSDKSPRYINRPYYSSDENSSDSSPRYIPRSLPRRSHRKSHIEPYNCNSFESPRSHVESTGTLRQTLKHNTQRRRSISLPGDLQASKTQHSTSNQSKQKPKFSFNELLNEEAINNKNYDDSATLLNKHVEIKKICHNALEASKNILNDRDVCIHLQFDAEHNVKLNNDTTDKVCNELIIRNIHGKIFYYLLDNEYAIGDGAQGTLIIGYDVTALANTKTKCISSFEVKKIKIKMLSVVINNDERKRKEAIYSLLPGYIGICDSSDSNPRTMILMSYIEGHDLNKCLYQLDDSVDREDPNHIIGKRYIQPFNQLLLILELMKQVYSLHTHNIVHRDLKPANIIVTLNTSKRLRCTLIDTDDAAMSDDLDNRHYGTPGYIPPENDCDKSTRRSYSMSSEHWALGVCMAEIAETIGCFQRGIKHKFKDRQSDQFLYEITFNRDDLSKLMPYVLSPTSVTLSAQFSKLNIYNTWINLPISELYQHLLPLLKSVVNDDLNLLLTRPSSVINEVIYQLYFFPHIKNIIGHYLNPDYNLRPTNEMLARDISTIFSITNEFAKLSHEYNRLYDTLHHFKSVTRLGAHVMIDSNRHGGLLMNANKSMNYRMQSPGRISSLTLWSSNNQINMTENVSLIPKTQENQQSELPTHQASTNQSIGFIQPVVNHMQRAHQGDQDCNRKRKPLPKRPHF